MKEYCSKHGLRHGKKYPSCTIAFMNKIRGSHEYYVLLCDCGKDKKHQLICGVYSSRKEAQQCADGIKDCVALISNKRAHTIKKCSVTVEY